MSWSFEKIGTDREAVRAKVAEEFDRAAKMYEGKEEGADVLAAKDRVLKAIDDFDLASPASRPDIGYALKVACAGSRGGAWMSLKCELSRMELVVPVFADAPK